MIRILANATGSQGLTADLEGNHVDSITQSAKAGTAVCEAQGRSEEEKDPIGKKYGQKTMGRMEGRLRGRMMLVPP